LFSGLFLVMWQRLHSQLLSEICGQGSLWCHPAESPDQFNANYGQHMASGGFARAREVIISSMPSAESPEEIPKLLALIEIGTTMSGFPAHRRQFPHRLEADQHCAPRCMCWPSWIEVDQGDSADDTIGALSADFR